ncbi:hypothetical protein SDC9_102756 [bioreactor metagenome]|uniref:Pyruvate ferredoxin oxidoreductase beta subunit C-terminal domain-containing protein n=1 Tax=bioreactor metagenome TaxID=1076179 RepID=A0A645AT64_9ZZZZ
MNTYEWYKQRVRPVSDAHDVTDFLAAMALAQKFGEEIPTGVLYKVEKPVFHDHHGVLQDHVPLIRKKTDAKKLQQLIQSFV